MIPKPARRTRRSTGPDLLLKGRLVNAYRNPRYLAFLRKQRCYCCPSITDTTASHLGRSYHGIKNHDWLALPMCPVHHYLWEYHKVVYHNKQLRWPTYEQCEKYFQKFLKQEGLADDRLEDQKSPI